MEQNQKYISVRGTPFEIGKSIGKSNREGIAEFIHLAWKELFSDLSEEFWNDLSEKSLEGVEREAPNSYQELQGLSLASQQDIRKVYLVGGCTDALDFMRGLHEDGGCTAITHSRSPIIYGQTYDLFRSFQPFTRIIEKEYENGVRTIGLGDILGITFMGVTSNGFSVGVNNLSEPHPTDGLNCRVLVNEMLQKASLSEALDYLLKSKRMSAHGYNLADENSVYFVELVPSDHEVILVSEEYSAHANHYLSSRLKSHEMHYSPTSPARFKLATELLNHTSGDFGELIKILSDHRGICRHEEEVMSLGAFVVNWSSREARFCLSSPCESTWRSYQI